MRTKDYLYTLLLLAVVAWMTVSCKKKVEMEPLTPRSYDLPEIEEDDLRDLPEDTGEDE